MRPPAESLGSSPNGQRMEDFLQDAVGTTAGEYSQKPSGQPDTDQDMLRTRSVSPVNGYKTHMIPSDADGSPFVSPNSSKRPKRRSRSSSSSSFTNHPLPDKQSRGFSRFFAKTKEWNFSGNAVSGLLIIGAVWAGWWRSWISVELVRQACLCVLSGQVTPLGCWNNTQLAVERVVASVCGGM